MATDHDTTRYQYENYRYCYDNGHSAFLIKAQRCFDFWSGEQWSPMDKAELAAAGRPALTLNIIESLVRAMMGVHKSLRNDVRFMPTQDASLQDAQIRDMLWLHAQNLNDYDMIESGLYEKGLIMGRAYVDVRVEFDDNLQGNVCIRPRRSQDIILDPSVDQYNPDTWSQVWQRRWVNNNDIEILYGKEKAKAVKEQTTPSFYEIEDVFMAQQMGRMPYYTSGEYGPDLRTKGNLLLDRQYYIVKKKDMFVDMTTGDMSEVPENWERERVQRVLTAVPGMNIINRDSKTVRWDVTCGDVLMHSEDSPYKWFTTVPFFPTFIDGISLGAVEPLIDPQMMFNKVTSQELHIINTTANSGYKIRKGALQNMTIPQLEQVGAKTGVVIELDDINNLEKITPNATPQGHDRLSFKADAIMRNLGGISNQGRGFAREDVAGEAIMANQAAQEINFATWQSNLNYTKSLVARRALDCFHTFYSDERIFLVNKGTTLSPEIQSVTINSEQGEVNPLNNVSSGKYTTVLIPSPQRTTMSEADFKLMLELRKMGIGIPDDLLIELSPANNKTQLLQKLQGDSNEAAQKAAEQAEAQTNAQLELLAAQTGKEQTAGMLNKARADKFAVEAVSDPEATYERVEMARIESDKALEHSRQLIQIDKNSKDYKVALEGNDIKRMTANTRNAAASKPKKTAPQKK